MTDFPKIETNRLSLESISYSDIPKIIEYAGNIKVAQTTLNIPHPYQERDAIFWINNANQGYKDKSQFTFGIRLKPTNKFIGGIGLKINARFNRAELGYWMAEPFWNKGYASEAVGVVLKYGFDKLELNTTEQSRVGKGNFPPNQPLNSYGSYYAVKNVRLIDNPNSNGKIDWEKQSSFFLTCCAKERKSGYDYS